MRGIAVLSRCRTLVVGLVAFGVMLSITPGAEARRLSFGSRDLHRGSHGTDVRVLQDFLTRVGVQTAVDGRFGSGTRRHVRVWERRSTLKVDGRVTKADAAVLRGQVAAGTSVLQSVPAPAAPAGAKATLGADGKAIAPAGAPPAVQQAIAAANAIVGEPYRYGGGHASFEDSGYDCSGSVSYALHGAALLDSPLPSGSLASWGEAGEGQWITVYANAGHAFAVIAGLRFDTGYNNSSSTGPKWNTQMRPAAGYVARHPDGL
jgi:putative peptidoglycan binding protein